ncbi:MAG: ceramidase domain-containing protein [Cyclobacteriaceae bacterium]
MIQIQPSDSDLEKLIMPDGGQYYAETYPERFFVEPWNALSSLLLILPAVYWAYRLRGRYSDYPFIFFCIVLLALGGMGSTLFHAFRSSSILLYMDVLPMALLTLSVGAYFWQKVSGSWWVALLIVLSSLLLRILVIDYFAFQMAGRLYYLISGLVIFVPMLIIMIRTKLRKGKLVLAALFLLLISLLFREIDTWPGQPLPMGTHFLWHAFSAAGAFYLASYLFYVENSKNQSRKADH